MKIGIVYPIFAFCILVGIVSWMISTLLLFVVIPLTVVIFSLLATIQAVGGATPTSYLYFTGSALGIFLFALMIGGTYLKIIERYY